MTAPVTTSSAPAAPVETISSFAISLAFWICLFVSAALFAVVALSPKLLVYLELRSKFEEHQYRLVTLEDQASRLKRIVHAIEHDPDFAAELTRVEFDAVRPGEEVIPVDASLKLETGATKELVSPPAEWPRRYEPFVKFFASDETVRSAFMTSAAFLVVCSFTLLQPAGAEQVRSGVRGCHWAWQTLRNRYTRA